MTALILGASGMVGTEVLDLLLADSRIEHVVSIVRRPHMSHAKLEEIEHTDFADFGPLKARLSGIDVCFYCVGVYTGQVPEREFSIITHDYLAELIRTLETASPAARFCLFSAMGADTSEQSRTLFARAKGRAENALTRSSFPRKHAFRAGYIHPSRPRKAPNLMYRLGEPFMGFVMKFYPGAGTTALELATVIVDVGLSPGDALTVFELRDLRSWLKAMNQPSAPVG